MSKGNRYYTLCELINGRWCPQFGDYDREVVAQERIDMHEGSEGPRLSSLKIVTTDDSHASIDAAVAKLNEAAA